MINIEILQRYPISLYKYVTPFYIEITRVIERGEAIVATNVLCKDKNMTGHWQIINMQ